MAERVRLFRSFYRAIRFALPERRAAPLIVALTLLIAAANAAEPPVLKVIFEGLTTRPALHHLAGGAEAVPELRELFRDDGILLIGERQLRMQLHRTLIGETRTVEVPSLLLAIPERRRIEMPADDGHLRLEMFEGPEFLHGTILAYPKPSHRLA